MKWLLRIIVIGAHLLAAVLLFGGIFLFSESEPNRDEGTTSASDPTGSENAEPADEPERERQTRGKVEDRESERSFLERLRRNLLSNRKKWSLPPGLKQKASDCTTGAVVNLSDPAVYWEKNLTKTVPVASLTKMMTALALIEYIEGEEGLSLDSEVTVSKDAAGMGGSQIYMERGESFTVRETLQAIMIFSACDAAYAAAEFFGDGQAARGVRLMNQRAEELGLSSLHFSNPHGLPVYEENEKPNRGNALDFSLLAAKLLQYPSVVDAASTWITYLREDEEEPFQLVNRNRLVKDIPGVNGMKTGYTDRAGWCMVLTYQKENSSFIVTVTGCESKASRNALAEGLLAWALKKSGQKGESAGETYLVKEGDTLYEIARTHGVSVPELKQANNLENNIIRKGEQLVIPE